MKDDFRASNVSRQRWMGVLAKAPLSRLEEACQHLPQLPAYEWLRPPETGLVMVRGRIGGTGAKFNVGEVPVTRCALTVRGLTGIAYVRGRSHRHAELAALMDALLQGPALRASVQTTVIEPLARAHAERRQIAERKAAATRVEFYTLARGESD